MSRKINDERMSAAQFAALMKLARLSSNGEGNRAARLVLVEGVSRAAAAERAGVVRNTLNLTLWRYAKLRELARVVCAGG